MFILSHTDGSTSLHSVAQFEGSTLTYTDGETNTTIWPGWFPYCAAINGILSNFILIVPTRCKRTNSTHNHRDQCHKNPSLCLRSGFDCNWSDLVPYLLVVQHHLQKTKVSFKGQITIFLLLQIVGIDTENC